MYVTMYKHLDYSIDSSICILYYICKYLYKILSPLLPNITTNKI